MHLNKEMIAHGRNQDMKYSGVVNVRYGRSAGTDTDGGVYDVIAKTLKY